MTQPDKGLNLNVPGYEALADNANWEFDREIPDGLGGRIEIFTGANIQDEDQRKLFNAREAISRISTNDTPDEVQVIHIDPEQVTQPVEECELSGELAKKILATIPQEYREYIKLYLSRKRVICPNN